MPIQDAMHRKTASQNGREFFSHNKKIFKEFMTSKQALQMIQKKYLQLKGGLNTHNTTQSTNNFRNSIKGGPIEYNKSHKMIGITYIDQ